MTGRLLIRGGCVVSLDKTVGTRAVADVLVEDGRIAAIEADLGSVDAEVVDASGTIVMPGFVDTHRHTWQTSVRGVLPSCLDAYLGTVIATLGPVYRSDDVYISNLFGALEALNAGVTTLLDWSHCNNTPDHADAGVLGLRESGIRAVYAHGMPASGEYWFDSVLGHPEDARRVRAQHFSSDEDLLTFALALRGPGVSRPEVVAHDWQPARDLDARISMHAGIEITGVHVQAVDELHRAGLLNAATTFIHLNTNIDAELALIAQAGASASVAPYIEMLMGHGHPPIGRLLAQGVTPSLSIDVTASVPGDMFTQMRTALVQDRIVAFGDDPDVAFSPTLMHEDVLRFATVAGAAACGLEQRVGSLTPGKDADIVLVRADAINTFPVVDPIATVVTSADTSNIDTVLVRGEFRKRGGVLVGVDMTRLRSLIEQSRDHVLNAAGMAPTWLDRAHAARTAIAAPAGAGATAGS